MANEERKSQRPVSAPASSEGAGAETAPADAQLPAGDGQPASPEQVEQVAILEASLNQPFGPAFFMTQLRAFAGEKCPDPSTARPVVQIHLGDGETLDLCHIIGVTPRWVALAVVDGEENETPRRMRTEFVPFEAIARVTLRASRPESPQLGFEANRVPEMLQDRMRPEMTPEDTIRAAATGTPEPKGD